jgi:hypothetical protein
MATTASDPSLSSGERTPPQPSANAYRSNGSTSTSPSTTTTCTSITPTPSATTTTSNLSNSSSGSNNNNGLHSFSFELIRKDICHSAEELGIADIRISQEEEERLLRELGWEPEEGSEFDDFLTDEEIEATRVQLQQQQQLRQKQRESSDANNSSFASSWECTTARPGNDWLATVRSVEEDDDDIRLAE